MKWSINKNAAPNKWTDFKRWYKAACNLPDVTAEQAFESLGYKVPKKDEDKRVKKEIEPIHGES